jgi:hypothetical protein
MADSSEVFDSAVFAVFSDRTVSLTSRDPPGWVNLEYPICHWKLRADIADASEAMDSGTRARARARASHVQCVREQHARESSHHRLVRDRLILGIWLVVTRLPFEKLCVLVLHDERFEQRFVDFNAYSRSVGKCEPTIGVTPR